MCSECQLLIKAIDAYIAKADNDLADRLKEEGYADSKNTVKHIEELEEKIAEVLQEQSKDFEDLIESADKKGIDLEEFLKGSWQEFKTTNDIREKLFPIFFNEFTEYVPVLANFYMKEMDSELIVEQISEKTTDWIAQWSYELSDLMHLSSHEEIENILVKGLKNGKGIAETARDVLESGIRDEFYKARRAALTETLRAHSFAREESIQQCPASEYKEWIHTGNHKIEPRPNHVRMNGQKVLISENFKLKGADGVTYLADFPKDPALPAAEVINCHCIHRSITSEEILGLPLEERKKLQQQAIDEMGDEWKKELDARNKARAGINEDTIKCDWLRNKKTVEERKKYFRSDSRWALFESGVIQNDADLERLYKTVDTKYGPRKVFKSLTELKNDGIMTVPHETLRHSTVGDYIKPSKDYPNGRLKNGGHSQKCIEELKNKGIDYKITKKYNNGVRLGYVPEHKQKTKQSGIGQSWFPENWDDNDILKAGTYTANHSKDSGMPKFAEYDGVRVGIFLDNDGFPSTIFPDNSEQP
ncbi:EndoU domain-containing protein [Porcipelethomonas ammoniilytica]|uniref:EndoU domain-containing protein n=1 Tax=Porcipelethomonas ammoniilytica TaxID=2981722 RepID=UPI0008222391|nr:EndoU domain-containing protein [Porcipelethomonas ammoniilytica]MCU6720617.1 EndoU domain-containing protein [Porcipelethomonas ammoniilytica]SCJ19120.1 Phage Mu protein F like protein [uncultured Ruminococcus sp.]